MAYEGYLPPTRSAKGTTAPGHDTLSHDPPTRTAKGTTLKEVRCEACRFEYCYRLHRQVFVGDPRMPWPGDGAWKIADDKLKKELRRGCDPVPCPACGWYQADMVKRLRRLKYQPWLIAAIILSVISSILAFMVVNSFSVGPTSPWGRACYFLLSFLVVSLCVALTCLGHTIRLAFSFDPNAADLERRKQLGRARTLAVLQQQPLQSRQAYEEWLGRQAYEEWLRLPQSGIEDDSKPQGNSLVEGLKALMICLLALIGLGVFGWMKWEEHQSDRANEAKRLNEALQPLLEQQRISKGLEEYKKNP
jgi:hypothetical protein